MMSVSIGGLTEPAKRAERPLSELLTTQWGMPADVTDELWRRGLAVHLPGGPALAPPSPELAAQIAVSGSDKTRAALASCVADADLLAELTKTPAAVDAAAENPLLPAGLCDKLASVHANDRLVKRAGARQLLADAVASGVADVDVIATELVDATEAIAVADLLEAADMGIASYVESEIASTVESKLSSPTWGAQGRPAQRTRAAVLDLLASRGCTGVVERIVIMSATEPGAPIDVGLLAHLADALESGALSGSQIRATFDTDAAAWGSFIDEVAPHIPAEQRQRSGPTEDEAVGSMVDALDLLGLSSVGTRVALATKRPLSDSMLDELFENADVDTIVDWAEHALPAAKPTSGEVARRILEADADLRREIAAEVDRRPNPLECNAELALCMTGTTAMPVAAARAVRVALQERAGDDIAAWQRFLDMLETSKMSVADMIDAAV